MLLMSFDCFMIIAFGFGMSLVMRLQAQTLQLNQSDLLPDLGSLVPSNNHAAQPTAVLLNIATLVSPPIANKTISHLVTPVRPIDLTSSEAEQSLMANDANTDTTESSTSIESVSTPATTAAQQQLEQSTTNTITPDTTENVIAQTTTHSQTSYTSISTPTAGPEHQLLPSGEQVGEGLSSGIIALVMAIAFSLGVIIIYAGLLLWRRYLEYRYGTRELLVNDLEFDTNDLRHFEL